MIHFENLKINADYKGHTCQWYSFLINLHDLRTLSIPFCSWSTRQIDDDWTSVFDWMSNWDILSTTLLWKMHYPIVCIVLSFMKKRSICIKSNSPCKEVLPKSLPQFLFNCGKNISWEHNGNKKFYFRKRNTLCTFFFPVRNKKVWWPKIVRLFLIDSCFMIWRLSKRYNLALNQSLLLETRHELVNSIDLKYDT